MLANQPPNKALFPGISGIGTLKKLDMFPSTLGWDATEGFWGYQTIKTKKDTGMEHISQDVYTGSFFNQTGELVSWVYPFV